MRVLWFCEVPTYDIWELDRSDLANRDGWIESLKSAILDYSPGVELAIAFPSRKLEVNFSQNNISYFPILQHTPRAKKVVDYWRHITDHPSTVARCLQIVDEWTPDVIHIFGTERAFGLVIPRIAVPSIVHIQGILTIYSRMWFRGAQLAQILREESPVDLALGRGLLHGYLRMKRAAVREQHILRQTRAVMGRTEWDRRMTMMLAPNAQYFHCDETMRPEFWAHQWQPQTRANRVIYSTLSETVYKGLETLLEAFVLLCARLNGYATLRIAGLRRNDRIASLAMHNFRRSWLASHVSFLGPIDADAVARELANADVFVHASHIDNSPNSVCEAMLVGTPLVSTNVGGIPSLVTNGTEGLLVQDGDPLAMAGAILELLMDPQLSQTLAANGRSRAKERHNSIGIARRVMSIYSQLLGIEPPPA